MITIGIDPDLVKSGVAMVEDGKIIRMESMSFPKLIDAVEFVFKNSDCIVKLEDPEVNKPIFWRNIKGTPEQKRKINLSIAQKVGMCKAAARLIHEVLESKGVACHKVKPLKGIAKKAKDDAAYFNRVTGWDKRSNQDTRDAAMIALYGVIGQRDVSQNKKGE